MTSILIAMLAGLAAALVAGFLGALIASIAAAASHMSTMEGGPGYFAAALGMISGLAGLIIGIVLTLRSRGVTSGAELLAGAAAAIAMLAAVGAGSIGIYWGLQPRRLDSGRPAPMLEYQIRPPAGAPLPTPDTMSAELQTDLNANVAPISSDVVPESDGRPVRAGYSSLYFRTSQRDLVLALPDEGDEIFRLRLPADPTGAKYEQWSDWQAADSVRALNASQRTRPDGPVFQVRYRVRAD